jgi:hypothetical protein
VRRTRAVIAAVVVSVARPAKGSEEAIDDSYEGIGARPIDSKGESASVLPARWPIEVHGLADVYLQHDTNRPPSGVTAYRPFDLATDTPSLGLLRATVAHRPRTFGFRVDAGVGDFANEYLRSDPAATEHSGLSRALSYAEQAYATAVLPVGRGLAIDVGKFGTPVGIEDNETNETWCYSRSLLYTLAEPTFHAGGRATYAPIRELTVSALVVNGWNTNVLAGNGLRSIGVAVAWRPSPSWEVSVVDLAGPERAPTRLADPTLTFRNVFDAYATFRLSAWIAFAAAVDQGTDARDDGKTWWGVGGYVHAVALPWLSATVRAERLADPDGYMSGTAQRIAEMTATVEAIAEVGDTHVATRLEYRRDQSDARVFESDGPRPLTHRDTATVAVIAWF